MRLASALRKYFPRASRIAVRLLCAIAFFLPSVTLWAQADSLRTGYRVVDRAGVLTSGERATLERTLHNFDKQASVEIFVVTVKSLNGRDANDYATEVGNSLAIGKKGLDNGIVILLVPSQMPPLPQ